MIIAAIIIGLIIIALFALEGFISSSGDGNMDTGFFLGMLVTIFLVFEIGIISNIIEESNPTPMDVYQGKTILEYTIRDGEIIDSVVVWKRDTDNED